MPQIPQLSVKRLKFHLSQKPFSHHVLRIGRSFGYFSPNHIDGWLPLIDSLCFDVHLSHNSASRFCAEFCGETSSATSETFSAPNFRRREGDLGGVYFNGNIWENINVRGRRDIPGFRIFELR